MDTVFAVPAMDLLRVKVGRLVEGFNGEIFVVLGLLEKEVRGTARLNDKEAERIASYLLGRSPQEVQFAKLAEHINGFRH